MSGRAPSVRDKLRDLCESVWLSPEAQEQQEEHWIYCIVEQGSDSHGPCKVGVAKNPIRRLSTLQAGNWRELRICWVILASDRRSAFEAEQQCLLMFRPNVYTPNGRERRRGLRSEWIDAGPAEIFNRARIFASEGEVILAEAL